MKAFWLDYQRYQVPETWSECKPEQVTQGLMLQLKYQNEADDRLKAHWQILMFRLLSELPMNLYLKLTGEQLQRLKPYYEWAFDERVTNRPFDSFAVNGIDYILPAEQFANTSAIELAMASIYYLQFANPKKPNTKAAMLLVATLCRPCRADHAAWLSSPDYNGDVREDYNSILAEARADAFENVPFGVIMAVLQYFEHMYTQFLQRYGEIFGEGDDDQRPLYNGGEGWIACLEEVAEIGSHGPFKAVCSENCHTIFLFLKHRTARLKRAEEEQEANRPDD